MPGPEPQSFLFAYVGSFTSVKRHGRGDGINVYAIDPVKGHWKLVQQVGRLTNPSWLHLNRRGTALYVGHGDTDYDSAFAVHPESGRLSPLGSSASGGENVVSCRLDRSGRFLVTANFATGTLGVVQVAESGALGPLVQIVTLSGEPRLHRRLGPQESSHPHDIVFDPSGRFVIVPDEGLDRVHIFRFKAGRLAAAEPGFVLNRSGSGPRHALFHPSQPLAWVVNVLDSTLVSYRWDRRRGRLTAFDVTSALPGDYAGDNRSNELVFDSTPRDILYIVNTPHDTFFKQRIDHETGVPTPIGWESVGGKRTRFFTFHEASRTFVVAFQDSDRIASFKVDERTGCLTPFGRRVRAPSPTCVELFSHGGHTAAMSPRARIRR